MDNFGLNRIVQCHICNNLVSMRSITQHLGMHNIKFIDYIKDNRNDFPNWHDCPICGNITKKKRTCSRECDKKFRQQQIGEKSVRWGAILTDNTKNKISKSQKIRFLKKGSKNYLIGNNNSSCRPEVRNRISNTVLLQGRNGEKNGMFGKTHTPEAVKKILSHRPMNKFEEAIANLLTENGYNYTFQFFITENGICKSYDFKIKGKPIIIEADGDFWHGNPEYKYHWKDSDTVQENDKIKEKMAKSRGYNIIRIWQSEFYRNPNVLMEKLNNSIFI